MADQVPEVTFEADLFTWGKALVRFDVPGDVRETFGQVRPPVYVTIGGHTFRSTVFSSDGRGYMVVNREMRATTGVEAGDRVAIALRLDPDPRLVEPPAELAASLEADPDLAAAWERLAPSHRREWAEHVGEAKRAETRERRLAQAIEGIKAGTHTG